MTATEPPSAPHPHGAMRRSDREITDRAAIDAILQSARVMYLALSDDDVPFAVPVFYAYDGASLYLHSAKGGSKIRILKRNNRVCFVVSLQHGVIESDQACDFEAKHRTVIGLGRAALRRGRGREDRRPRPHRRPLHRPASSRIPRPTSTPPR